MFRYFVQRKREITNYASNLGWLSGVCVYWKLYVTPKYSKLAKTQKVNLPSYESRPVYVRVKTSDVWVFEQIFLQKAYDLTFLNLNPKVIFDVGANVGYSAIFFAHTYPEAHIFAVEPENSNFQLLRKNSEYYPNITTLQAALWKTKGTVQIANPNAEKWAFQVAEPSDNVSANKIGALTMGNLLEKASSERIDILKLDIEGSEVELFSANCESWLDKVSVIIIELHDRLRKGCSETFYSATKSYDFKKLERQEDVILYKKKKL